MRKVIVIFLQCAVTIILLVWILESPTLREQIHTLTSKDLNLTWVWIGIGAALIGNMIGVMRWWIYIKALEMPMHFMRAVELYFIGALFNGVMPGMVGGDVVKIGYLIAEGYKKTAVVMSIMLDRISGFGVLALAAIALPAMHWGWFHSDPAVVKFLWISFFSITITFFGLAITLFGAGKQWMKKLPEWIPFREDLDRLANSYFVLASHWIGTLWASFLSAIMLILYFLTFYAAARAVGLDMRFIDFSSIMPMVDIIVSLPISIGGLGVREHIFKTVMSGLWNTLPNIADKAILVSLGGWLFMAAGGLPGLIFLPLYKGLVKREKELRSVEPQIHTD